MLSVEIKKYTDIRTLNIKERLLEQQNLLKYLTLAQYIILYVCSKWEAITGVGKLRPVLDFLVIVYTFKWF